MRRAPIEILHLVYGHYPADTRVKRELRALSATGCRRAVIAVRGEGEAALERVDDVVTIRVPGHKSRGGLWSYVVEYGDFVLRCRRLVAAHRAFANVQVVHVHTLPDFLMWAALPARRRGARLVFDMHEIMPEFTRAKFPGPLGTLMARLARRIERWARRRADLTVTVNRPIDQLLASRPATPDEHRIIVHNTADPGDFGHDVRAGETLPPPLLPAAPLRLVYHGTLTHLYGLDIAVRGVALANANGLDVQLTIIGDGPERGRLEEAVGVTVERPMTHKQLAARLPQFHAGLVPTRLNEMTRYSLSTKLLEYVHLGLPVLAAELPSYRLYFGADTLWFWTANDPAALATVIRAFVQSDRAQRARRIAKARQVLEPLAWPVQAMALLAAYQDLLTRPAQQPARIAATRSAAVPSP